MRNIKIYTGVGGMDLFEEAMENQVGLKRQYLGKKVIRILRRSQIPIKKSLTGKFYKLIKTEKYVKFQIDSHSWNKEQSLCITPTEKRKSVAWGNYISGTGGKTSNRRNRYSRIREGRFRYAAKREGRRYGLLRRARRSGS